MTARRWHDALAARVDGSAAGLPKLAPSRVAFDERIRVSAWMVAAAGRCPASLGAPDGEFVPNAHGAARRVALAALARLGQPGGPSGVTEAVESALTDLDGDPRFPGDFLAGLDAAGRAAVAIQARTMVVATVRDLGQPDPDWFDAEPPGSWAHPSRPVEVLARWEALAGDRVLLLARSPQDPDVIEAAGHLAALVRTTRGRPPGCVVHRCLTTGRRTALEVDDAALERACDLVAATVAAVAAVRLGPAAAEQPGPWCRRCGRLADCDTGRHHLAATPVRIGGLIPTPPP